MNKSVEYKGYYIDYKVNIEEHVLYGYLIFDGIEYYVEGESLKDLQKNLENYVDSML